MKNYIIAFWMVALFVASPFQTCPLPEPGEPDPTVCEGK